jgi:hypothetical protein
VTASYCHMKYLFFFFASWAAWACKFGSAGEIPMPGISGGSFPNGGSPGQVLRLWSLFLFSMWPSSCPPCWYSDGPSGEAHPGHSYNCGSLPSSLLILLSLFHFFSLVCKGLTHSRCLLTIVGWRHERVSWQIHS